MYTSMIIVATIQKAATGSAVFWMTWPSPIYTSTTAQAAMILFRQIPFPAEAPESRRVSIAVMLVPVWSAVIFWIDPNVKFDMVALPLKKLLRAPTKAAIEIHPPFKALVRLSPIRLEGEAGPSLMKSYISIKSPTNAFVGLTKQTNTLKKNSFGVDFMSLQ